MSFSEFNQWFSRGRCGSALCLAWRGYVRRAFLALLCLSAAAGTGWAAYVLVSLFTFIGSPLWMMLLAYFSAAQFAVAAGVMVAGAWRTLREG